MELFLDTHASAAFGNIRGPRRLRTSHFVPAGLAVLLRRDVPVVRFPPIPATPHYHVRRQRSDEDKTSRHG